VLAVYGVGFTRTQDAAARLAAMGDRPRVTIPDTPVAGVPRAGESRPDVDPQPGIQIVSALPFEPVQAEAGVPVAPEPSVPMSTGAADLTAPAPGQEPPAAEAAAEPTPAPQTPPLAQWKDGTYNGWGSSRHGDIQASVVIEEGRIVSATIAQCRTRYSCSWISKLPPQVVARQSPETDFISGATQSTNAFYYGVVEALSKAK
jgi:uncharacterized protein with FMN-binding domain